VSLIDFHTLFNAICEKNVTQIGCSLARSLVVCHVLSEETFFEFGTHTALVAAPYCVLCSRLTFHRKLPKEMEVICQCAAVHLCRLVLALLTKLDLSALLRSSKKVNSDGLTANGNTQSFGAY